MGGSQCHGFNLKKSVLKQTLVVVFVYLVGPGSNKKYFLNLKPCFRGQVNALFSVTLSLAKDLRTARSS